MIYELIISRQSSLLRQLSLDLTDLVSHQKLLLVAFLQESMQQLIQCGGKRAERKWFCRVYKLLVSREMTTIYWKKLHIL